MAPDPLFSAQGTGREGSWPKSFRKMLTVFASRGLASSLPAELAARWIASRIACSKTLRHSSAASGVQPAGHSKRKTGAGEGCRDSRLRVAGNQYRDRSVFWLRREPRHESLLSPRCQDRFDPAPYSTDSRLLFREPHEQRLESGHGAIAGTRNLFMVEFRLSSTLFQNIWLKDLRGGGVGGGVVTVLCIRSSGVSGVMGAHLTGGLGRRRYSHQRRHWRRSRPVP